MNTNSRMRSLYLSKEWVLAYWVSACGLLKSTLWWMLPWIGYWLHQSWVTYRGGIQIFRQPVLLQKLYYHQPVLFQLMVQV